MSHILGADGAMRKVSPDHTPVAVREYEHEAWELPHMRNMACDDTYLAACVMGECKQGRSVCPDPSACVIYTDTTWPMRLWRWLTARFVK